MSTALSPTHIYQQHIKMLQVDLVSACNAKCWFCYRQDDSGNPNPHYPKGKTLRLDHLEKALKSPHMDQLEEVLLCGNYGDAMATPHIVEFVDKIDELRPGLGMFLHTNAGLGTKKTWTELASRFSKGGRFIKFSIDGLADTNHIYRRGVSWETIMENTKTFIEAGGRAVWKFIVFPHNKHQIEEARKLSEQMGFKRFEIEKNYSPSLEPIMYGAAPQGISAPEDYMTSVPANMKINCDSRDNATLFLDFEGAVWPCCFIGGSHYGDRGSLDLHNQWGKTFNSLEHHTLEEILEHPWFSSELEKSWNNQAKLHHQCPNKCGNCK